MWDTRAWSFFMYMITLVMFLAALCTPYKLKGVYVNYGPHDGLWTIEDPAGFHVAVKVLMVLALLCLIITGICYFILFKRSIPILHAVLFISQMIGGVCAAIAGGIYMANSDDIKGDGMWMSLSTGLIFIINGVVIACIPLTQFEIGHKSGFEIDKEYSEDDMLEAAQQRSHRVRTASGGEEEVPLKKPEEDPEIAITPASPPEKNTHM